MPIVTLMTDFGNKDYAVAAVKGAILSTVENPKIVDISHQITPYNPTEAAYILKNAYKTFPKDSIHIIGVESEKTPENHHLAMYFDGHYFIGADNGIFAMIKGDFKADKIVAINIHEQMPNDYPIMEAFVWVAAHLSREGSLEVIGKKVEHIKEIKELRPVVNNSCFVAKSQRRIVRKVEGLYIDKNVSFADLKQTLLYFTKALFGNSKIRLRPSYFPFTEPSAEVDIYWGLETETDFRITKGTGWLEIMGCGMVDPNVLKNCKINPEEYSGYAFGMGIERIAMLLYQIGDIRLFFENDIRFLSQFQSEN